MFKELTNFQKANHDNLQATYKPSDKTVESIKKNKGISTQSIMMKIINGIQQQQQNLNFFRQHVKRQLDLNKQIKKQCSFVLQNPLNQLKNKFSQFANQWKVYIPQICQQFMEIMRKICTLYQQQLQKLNQSSLGWQHKYQQLIKPNNSKLKTSGSQEKIKQLKSSQHLDKLSQNWQKIKLKQLKCKNNFNDNSIQNQQLITILDQHTKPRQWQLSLMKQQITQLFQQEQIQDLIEQQCGKKVDLHIKDELSNLINDQVRQFRIKTSSDQQHYININNQQLASSIHVRQKNISNFSSKSSQQNSRKNSISSKDQFWNCLKSGVGSQKSKSNSDQNKQNNINIGLKDKLINASKEDQRSQNVGTKLSELRKNLYKNKNSFDYR